MKIVKVPETVKLIPSCPACRRELTNELPVPFSFMKFLTMACDEFEPLGKGIESIEKSVRIAGAIKKMDGTLRLEDDLYEIVNRAVGNDPAVVGFPWRPAVSRPCVEYFRALKNAKDEEEKEKKEKEEEKKEDIKPESS